MNEGAATLSLEGRILYGNRRLGEMVKAPLGRVIGSSLVSFMDGETGEHRQAAGGGPAARASRGISA